MIQISNITVRFGGVVAIDSLTATLSAPISGIIGPNGAGKTTLLNVLSGFVEPTDGSIQAHGVDLLRMQPFKRARWGLRRSFQTEQIVGDLTVADNVRVVVDSLAFKRNEQEAELSRVLDFVGLFGKRNIMGERLTSFDRRMTEIAKTLIGRPRVVMFDEPGGGLGEHEASELRDVIDRIPDQFNVKVLLIDHDVDLIRAVCQETLVLDFGKKIAEGETNEVLRDEKVRAAYLGEEVAV
jgi:branched-chain amino acid transport system ATP-binding protein